MPQQRAIDVGEAVVVGVNEYADDQEVPSVPGLITRRGGRRSGRK